MNYTYDLKEYEIVIHDNYFFVVKYPGYKFNYTGLQYLMKDYVLEIHNNIAVFKKRN